jgi:hypothetical protein
MVHLGATRNLNEIYGAYGHDLTFDEVVWLANWALIRGQNLLVPHAFYYATRGPRVDERPPDVGPNSPWWDRFGNWAKAVSRLCYLNTVGVQQCRIAVLCGSNHLPDQLVKPLYEHQLDFNYIMASDLCVDGRVRTDGIHIQQMHYAMLVTDGSVPLSPQQAEALKPLIDAGRLIDTRVDGDVIKQLDALIQSPLQLSTPEPNLRLRHVIADGAHWLMLFNEGDKPIEIRGTVNIGQSPVTRIDLARETTLPAEHKLSFTLAASELQILHCPR